MVNKVSYLEYNKSNKNVKKFNHSLNHNYQIGRKQKIQNFKLKTREIEKLLSKWGTQQLMGDRGHKPCICPIAKQT